MCPLPHNAGRATQGIQHSPSMINGLDCYLQISKQDVQHFCIFHNTIPMCQFSIFWCKESCRPVRLTHKVKLKGTTERKRQYFLLSEDTNITLSTQSTQSTITSHTTRTPSQSHQIQEDDEGITCHCWTIIIS